MPGARMSNGSSFIKVAWELRLIAEWAKALKSRYAALCNPVRRPQVMLPSPHFPQPISNAIGHCGRAPRRAEGIEGRTRLCCSW
jgi:hypothetical protein